MIRKSAPFLALAVLMLLGAPPAWSKVPSTSFDLEAHRGGRDLYPENTLFAFRKALELGVTTLEGDLCMTKDGVLVLSHNPFLEPHLAKKDGKWLTKPVLIRGLTLKQLKGYDVGGIDPRATGYWESHGKRQQHQTNEPVPTLDELFRLVRQSGKNVLLNLETKLDPRHPEWGPDPKTFARTLHTMIEKYGFQDRVMVQSFDWRTLKEMKKLDPRITLVALTCETPEDPYREEGKPGASPWMGGLDIDQFKGSWVRAAKAIGADVVSPYFREVTKDRVDEAHQLGLKLVPWTVNRKLDMREMLDLSVDGIITDAPDTLREVMEKKGMPLPPR